MVMRYVISERGAKVVENINININTVIDPAIIYIASMIK